MLQIGTGVFWTLVYVLIAKRGFQDKTYGMPLVALCANISWEFIFSFVHPPPAPQLYINIVWFLFDVMILFQFIKFGRPSFDRTLLARLFIPVFLLSLIFSFLTVISITYEFRDLMGKYSAFGQNFMMSVLFVTMLANRNNVKGQSIYIAIFKMIGSASSSILFYTFFPSSFLLKFLYVAIFVFDWIYIILLYNKHKELRINPWKRL